MSTRKTRTAEARRRGELKRGGPNLIPIEDVAILFNKSVKTMRTYKALGLIDPVSKNGNQDLFSRTAVLQRKEDIEKLAIKGMSLGQIGRALPKELAHEAGGNGQT